MAFGLSVISWNQIHMFRHELNWNFITGTILEFLVKYMHSQFQS